MKQGLPVLNILSLYNCFSGLQELGLKEMIQDILGARV